MNILKEEEREKSRELYGSNELEKGEKETFLKKLLGAFNDPMIKILCVALGLNVVFAIMGQAEWIETIGIAVAIVLATTISTWAEYKNENTFQELQDEANKINVKIVRED